MNTARFDLKKTAFLDTRLNTDYYPEQQQSCAL
jgi:hypothetical protein